MASSLHPRLTFVIGISGNDMPDMNEGLGIKQAVNAVAGNITNLSSSDSKITNLDVFNRLSLYYIPDTYLLYMDGDTVQGTSSFTFNGTEAVVPSLTISDLTSGRVPYATTGGSLVDSDLYWNNTNKRLGVGVTTGTGTLTVSGAISCRVEANAFGAGAYAALIVGQGDAGGLYAVGRASGANAPFVGLSGFDWGSGAGYDAGRVLYFGGGAWDAPDATGIQFYTSATYTETVDTGIIRMAILNDGKITVNNTTADELFDVTGLCRAQTFTADGDVGSGTASTTRLTGVTDTPTTDPGWATSSTVNMNAPNGYLKLYVGTQAVTVPYWNT